MEAERAKSVEKEEINKSEDDVILEASAPAAAAGGVGWGGWRFSPLSVFSDLQKAAEEISRNGFQVDSHSTSRLPANILKLYHAAKSAYSLGYPIQATEAAKTAAKSIADMQNTAEYSEEDDTETSDKESETEDEDDKKRKAALEKLENASENTLLGQGLKVLDSSVETIASGAWQAFGNAWKGGSSFVQKLESSATSLVDSINQGGLPAASSVAPSIIETGKAFTARGKQVLEHVGKETMDLLIAETGIQVDKYSQEGDEDQLLEEVTFDRCFYIYGGPEQLEELEALSSHYALLFNRRKAKLSSEQKSMYDAKLKQVQQIFSLGSEFDANGFELEKGKQKETTPDATINEMKSLHDSSVAKAAEMAAGFANALAGLAPSDIILRTAGRLDTLHSEGIHRISEMCCFAVSQLLILGKSVLSNASKSQDHDSDDDIVNIDWPEDSVEKAKIIRIRTRSMNENVEAVCNSFITGISDVAEAFAAAIKVATVEMTEVLPQKPVHEKTQAFSENLRVDQTTAIGKIQDGLQYLSYLVLTTSMPAV